MRAVVEADATSRGHEVPFGLHLTSFLLVAVSFLSTFFGGIFLWGLSFIVCRLTTGVPNRDTRRVGKAFGAQGPNIARSSVGMREVQAGS